MKSPGFRRGLLLRRNVAVDGCAIQDKKPRTEVRGLRGFEPNRYRDSRPTVFTAITR
jgi:hypothetical protein